MVRAQRGSGGDRQARRPVVISSACGTCPGSTGSARSASPRCCSTTPTSPGCPGGFLGVDVFFAISGYLITSLLLAEFRNRGGVNVGQFYLRRARRLLPALFLVLGVGRRCSRSIFLPDEVHALRGDVVAALGYAHELVADLPAPVVRRGAGPAAAAAAPVVARGRGAVLPDLAAAARRHAASSGRVGARRCCSRRSAIALVSFVLMLVLSLPHDYPIARSVTRLLRQRRPHLHAAPRRRARDGVVTVAALGARRRPGGADRPRRRSASSGLLGSRTCSSR